MKYLLYFCWLIYIGVVVVLLGVSMLSQPGVLGSRQAYIIRSGSMEPTIKTGAVILIDTKVRPPAPGDIITFTDEHNTIITHRVIKEEIGSNQSLYTTQGDNNEDPDPQPIVQDNIIGHFILSVPYIGYFVVYTTRPVGLILLVLIPIALYLAGEVSKKQAQPAPKKNTERSTSLPPEVPKKP